MLSMDVLVHLSNDCKDFRRVDKVAIFCLFFDISGNAMERLGNRTRNGGEGVGIAPEGNRIAHRIFETIMIPARR